MGPNSSSTHTSAATNPSANPRIQLTKWQRLTLRANLVAQVGIVLTGGIVRVTSSGLGCPTWPECVEGSITPTSSQTEAWHKYIEFGNRTLTFALALIAVLTILAIRSFTRAQSEHNEVSDPGLRILSYGGLIGIFAQAILGGITVLTGLHPLTVAAHFLLSIGLITLALALQMRAEGVWRSSTPVPTLVFRTIKATTAIAFLVITIGTLVTGSGPHAGDSADISRLPIDPRLISWLHADVVILFSGLVIAIALLARATKCDPRLVRAIDMALIVTVSQGALGYVQYFTSLPWALVALHMLGACVLWISMYRVYVFARFNHHGN